jgi:condensin complex subunit 1
VFEGLLSHFTPIVLKLVHKIDEVKTEILQKTLVISLAKFMCINPKICEDNLESLLKIAAKHENFSIRSNAVVGLGDLVMRHPNILERYSSSLFDLLADPVLIVRKKALLIISHLVLNDMLKMKGLMANILKCFLDKDLRGVVTVFIEELNQKSPNDIFNMIPDSLSNLLKMKLSLNEFKSIADMIFSYINKERQGEGLFDRISTKFKDSNKEECLQLGYCLTRLPVNEKALRKLMDNVSWWQSKILEDNTLQSFFSEIAIKCKKTWRTENKTIIDEFEAAVRGEGEVVKKRKGRC